MAKMKKFDDFITEGFFRKLGAKKRTISSNLDDCVKQILDLLGESDIHTWDDFQSTNKIDRYLISKIIDRSTKNMKELEEVRFKLRLELSNTIQLREYIKELEQQEDYEKCAIIVKKLSS